MKRMRLLLASLIALLSSSVFACSWTNLSPENVGTLLPEHFAAADAVIRARVTAREIRADKSEVAQVQVIRAFKGPNSPAQLIAYPHFCGYGFTVGEERIYFVNKGVVSIAGVEPVSPWLLKALEEAKKKSH